MLENKVHAGFARAFGSLSMGVVLVIGVIFALGKYIEQVRAAPDSLFVKPGGSGGACSQAQPCNLGTALATAAPGDSLYLAGGDYTASGPAVMAISQDLAIYGGWDGTTQSPVRRNPVAYPSILDAQDSRRGVMIEGPATVTLEGVSVKNGFAEIGGAGLYSRNADLALREVIFESNAVTKTDFTYGGGALVWGGNVVVDGCRFVSNTADSIQASYGGGIVISDTTSASVENSTFYQNTTWWGSALTFLGAPGSYADLVVRNNDFLDHYAGYVGAVYVKDANAVVAGNTISGSRSANDYGAMAFYDSKVDMAQNTLTHNWGGRVSGVVLERVDPFTLTNNIIAGNESAYDWLRNPAVRISLSNGKFLNNTVAGNSGAYGILLNGTSTVAFTNTILVSHTVGISVTAGSSATLEATLWGSGAWANGTDTGGAGSVVTGSTNYHDDPVFANPAGWNYHISSGSGAIDRGIDDGVPVDIDGDPRPQGAGYDIGADEHFEGKVFLPIAMRQ